MEPRDGRNVAHGAWNLFVPFSLSGFQLLPETYVVLIYAFLNLAGEDKSGADLDTASSLLESMKVWSHSRCRGFTMFQAEVVFTCVPPPSLQAQVGIPGAQPGWLMLCKELFRKEMIDEAMSRVKRGYDADG